jgi:hypothetical protein
MAVGLTTKRRHTIPVVLVEAPETGMVWAFSEEVKTWTLGAL